MAKPVINSLNISKVNFMAIFEAGLCKHEFGFDIEFAFAGFKRVYDCQRDHFTLVFKFG